MGGCRCTYKNCTVRSDGKTHLFHFPVFDKVRCHQWLINSGRYDFLNLKVSQLKNRCVCQHHFADCYFMNSQKDKLKLNAIPTEDGPYCTPIPKEEGKKADQIFNLYSITHDDIENDEYICDRKANYNIKYADFLTNCEQVEPLQNSVKHTVNVEENFITQVFTHNNPFSSKELPNINNSQMNTSPWLPPQNQIQTLPVYVHNTVNKTPKKNMSGTRNKVRIISEKKITEPEKQFPVPVSTGTFEVVSPSMVLNVNKKTNNITSDNLEAQSTIQIENNIIVEPVQPKEIEIEFAPQQNVLPPPKDEPTEEKTAKVPVANKKMTAERIAAINEKRKFNMKLKDIIEAGLTRLVNQDSPKNKTTVDNLQIQQPKTETVASSLSKELSLPNHSEYIVSFLEARMKRMENLLLSKIDQNTQKIMELKKSFDPQEEDLPVSKQSTRSTKLRDEAHKRHLFKEISKYLTPDVKSSVYEELFINQYTPINRTESEQPRKRRKSTAPMNKT